MILRGQSQSLSSQDISCSANSHNPLGGNHRWCCLANTMCSVHKRIPTPDWLFRSKHLYLSIEGNRRAEEEGNNDHYGDRRSPKGKKWSPGHRQKGGQTTARESSTSRVVRRPLSMNVAVVDCLKRKFSADLTTKISPFGGSGLSDSGSSKVSRGDRVH